MTGREKTSWAEIAGKAQRDLEFRAQLIEDPRAALNNVGVEYPQDKRVVIVEDTDSTRYLVIPLKSRRAENVSDEAIEASGRAHLDPFGNTGNPFCSDIHNNC